MKTILLSLAIVSLTSANSYASDISIGLGTMARPGDGGTVIRLEGRTEMPEHWLSPLSDKLHGYWQANVNAWSSDQSHYSAGVGLGADYSFNERWKIELGWGALMLDDRYIDANHDMGSEFNFETTLGLRYTWQQHALRLNLYHWSNAGLASKNPGCEIVIAAYQYRF